MMTIIFFVLFFMIFGRLLGFAFKATWGIMKFLFYIVFLPFILVGMVAYGFAFIALPILLRDSGIMPRYVAICF